MSLRAHRFRFNPVLQRILAGQHRLEMLPGGVPPYETGKHVRKIQQALLDTGFTLSQFGADSEYGPETARAVSEFKAREGLSPADGVVGQGTMRRLDEIFADEPGLIPPTPGPGEMSADEFLEALQAAQDAHPADTPEQFLTRLRQMYYPGPVVDTLTEIKFDHLMPAAPARLPDGARRLIIPGSMDGAMFNRLARRAFENARPPAPPDNPSPYVLDLTGAQVDLGHLLLTLDAHLHPASGTPYADYGVPSIDPASWVADLGIAAIWTELDGLPDAPRRLPPDVAGQPDFAGYFEMSAPIADLTGDIDGFNVAQLWIDQGGPLSRPLASYYLDGETVPGGYRRRFRSFVSTIIGSPDDPSSWRNSRRVWETRINRFNDLYNDGASAFFHLSPPPPRSWRFTPAALDAFYSWLEAGLAWENANFD